MLVQDCLAGGTGLPVVIEIQVEMAWACFYRLGNSGFSKLFRSINTTALL